MALAIACSGLGLSTVVVRSPHLTVGAFPLRDLRPLHGQTSSLLKSPARRIDTKLKRTAIKGFCLRDCPKTEEFDNNVCTELQKKPILTKNDISCSKAEVQASEDGTTAIDMTQFKHVLLPVMDKNPYLTEGTKQAAATTTALAKTSGAKITVIVVDENAKDAIADYDTRLSSIRWHLAQGGFEEFGLIERLGKGNKPTAIVGEIADDMNVDLVVMSMESIHLKHVDGNLLAEFIPCPVLLLPL